MTVTYHHLLSVLDQSLPWLLPTLETIEQVFPLPYRLLLCACLALRFAVTHRPLKESAFATRPLAAHHLRRLL